MSPFRVPLIFDKMNAPTNKSLLRKRKESNFPISHAANPPDLKSVRGNGINGLSSQLEPYGS